MWVCGEGLGSWRRKTRESTLERGECVARSACDERRAAVGALAQGWSMSSIKRDVKKKSSASTGGERICFSRSSPLFVRVPLGSRERFWSGVFANPCGVHLPMVTTPIESGKVSKRVLVSLVSTMVLSEARGLSLFLLQKVARRVNDADVMRLLKLILSNGILRLSASLVTACSTSSRPASDWR